MEQESGQSRFPRASFSSPTVLVVVLRLLGILACVLGIVGAVIAVRLGGYAHSGADLASVALEAVVCACIGGAVGAVLFAVARLVSCHHVAAFTRQRVLSVLERISRMPSDGGGEQSAVSSALTGESELLRTVVAELREANANMLLSPAERRRKARLLDESRVSAEVQEVEVETRRASDLMATAAYDRALEVARRLVERYPSSEAASRLFERTRREGDAYRDELRTRLYAVVQRSAESRNWAEALDAAERLIDSCGDCVESEAVAAMLPTLRDNARIEEVRRLRDRFGDMIRRKRYRLAMTLAGEIIEDFPDTKAAVELQEQMSRLRELAAGQGDAESPVVS